MDLAYCLVSAPDPHRLVFTTVPGGMRYGFAAVLGAVALWFAVLAWRAASDGEAWLRWLGIAWYLAPALFFLAVASVVGFGRERITLDAQSRMLDLARGFGPFNWSHRSALPPAGVVRVTLTKERSGSTDHWVTNTRYTARIAGLEGFELVSVNDRDRLLEAAERVARLLAYRVENLAVDDGIERKH